MPTPSKSSCSAPWTRSPIASTTVAARCFIAPPGRRRHSTQSAIACPATPPNYFCPKLNGPLRLTDVQDGFFIRKRRGTPNVQLVNSAGIVEHWDMDHATKELLMARRNATHGFGEPEIPRRRQRADTCPPRRATSARPYPPTVPIP